VPFHAVNRFCGSGLEACAIIAAKIKAGFLDCGIGAGVESMSVYEMTGVIDVGKLNDKCFSSQASRNVLTTMGRTSEVTTTPPPFTFPRTSQPSTESPGRNKTSSLAPPKEKQP